MTLLRDAILKELQRAGGDEFHVSQEFFANVRSLCQEHARQEAKLNAVARAVTLVANEIIDMDRYTAAKLLRVALIMAREE